MGKLTLYKTREDVEQLFDIYKNGEDFETTGMHSREACDATFFLNHLCVMMAYKIYNELQKNNSLEKYAASKICSLLWDVRATGFETGYQLEPIPKMARLAINATGLEAPDKIDIV